MTMGRQNIIDKTIHPSIRPLTTITSITPAGVISDVARAGTIPIGNYKGVPAFWDLDKAVNQPLVTAEDRYILGMLDGRLLGSDMAVATFAIADPLTTQRRARITVPMGQVWYLNAVSINAIKDATAAFDVNWRCSLWADPAVAPVVPDVDGQTFLAGDTVGAANTVVLVNSLFGVLPVITNIGYGVLAATNLGIAAATPKTMPTLLRLKGGDWITMQATVRIAVTAAATPVVFSVTGYVAKPLVA